jgi:hypothetical protein
MMTFFPDRRRSDDALVAVVRRLAVAVVTPACVVLTIGLLRAVSDAVFAANPGALDAPTVPLHELAKPDTLMSPLGMLTAGLAAFAALPAITLLAIAVARACQRRWREVCFTCGVLATLGIAACIGHR